MKLRSGTLNRIINVRFPTTSGRSTDGEPTFTWSTVLTEVWADKQPISGRELFRQDVRWAECNTKWILRYVSTLTSVIVPTARVIDLADSSAEYDIKAVIDIDNENKAWELITQKVT